MPMLNAQTGAGRHWWSACCRYLRASGGTVPDGHSSGYDVSESVISERRQCSSRTPSAGRECAPHSAMNSATCCMTWASRRSGLTCTRGTLVRPSRRVRQVAQVRTSSSHRPRRPAASWIRSDWLGEVDGVAVRIGDVRDSLHPGMWFAGPRTLLPRAVTSSSRPSTSSTAKLSRIRPAAPAAPRCRRRGPVQSYRRRGRHGRPGRHRAPGMPVRLRGARCRRPLVCQPAPSAGFRAPTAAERRSGSPASPPPWPR